MTAERRCPSCDRPVQAEFSYCPYCRAAMQPGAARAMFDVPEGSARRDLGYTNLGLILLSAFGGVGIIWAVLSAGWATDGWLLALGVPFMLAFALTLLVRGGPGRAVLNGALAVGAAFGIGLMIVGAFLLYFLIACSNTCQTMH
jgi:hypothetical protein